MKPKLSILFIASFFVFSCSTIKYIERVTPGETSVSFLDFKPYLERGFIFSTGEINQTYSPIGVLYQITEPDIVKIYRPFNSVITESMKSDGTFIIENDQEYVLDKSVPKQKGDLYDILQNVYEFAKQKGANGVINLKYSILSDKSIEVSGTLIKIEKL